MMHKLSYFIDFHLLTYLLSAASMVVIVELALRISFFIAFDVVIGYSLKEFGYPAREYWYQIESWAYFIPFAIFVAFVATLLAVRAFRTLVDLIIFNSKI